MTKKFMPALIASMVGATVMTPIAYGQAAPAITAAEACEALLTLNEENRNELRPEWIEESQALIDAGDAERCLVYYEEATAALGNTGEVDATAAARIVVTQPDPNVSVDQAAPQVSVTNPEPSVRVNQGQPEIIVRQAPPNVLVEVPQPIITIDQPQPQIIVRMPEPDIAVTNPQPQVDVVQAQPQVTVEQPEAQVALTDQATSPAEATIDVDQAAPQVYLEDSGAPQVAVESGEPVISYEAAEPNIQVEQVGEPEIRFNQSGEADVQFEQGAAVEGGAMATGTADTEMYAVLLVQEEVEAGQMMQYNASDLAGRNLTTVSGQALGSVDRVVDQGGTYYVVVTDGSAFGMQGEAGLPLENISVQNGELVFRGLTEQQLGTVTEFDPAGAQPLGATDRVEIGTL
ncbi:PRC-barrel domain-containing protein [Devosia sp. RR2S18]|uniref:PRC-barrel domain-containing protein n=1 Tax=Devosia rhizosphaerae TaxID=3049774 RepID=UPI002540B753|nr:PRC-barrel domain-containing protein [Devosia sp. RR2S18]WIJ25940.1 hypothetical protein QOV41_04020 [Devosia sp. RR2S18]